MKAPKKLTLDKNKILSQLATLPAIAKRHNWKLEYDQQLDELVFGKAEMPKDSFLFSINKELNLFLTPGSNVNGIFIEYFATNYIEHNKDFKPVLELLKDDNEEEVDLADLLKKALEERLALEAVESVTKGDELVTAV